MGNRTRMMAAALAATCLTSWVAFAADGVTTSGSSTVDTPYTSNEIELGLLGVGGTNPGQAGRYDGLTTKGLDILGQFDLESRPGGDSTWYYDFTGDDLVFQTGTDLGSGIGSADGSGANYRNRTANNLAPVGYVALDFGQQGTWETHLAFDSISYTGNVIDSIYRDTNSSVAILNNGLTPWGGATEFAPGGLTKSGLTIPALIATGGMRPFQTGTRRDRTKANFKYIDGNWTFVGSLWHEHKYGSMEESFFGPWGGTAFAQPINYITNTYNISAEYATRKDQILLEETYSHFQDGDSYINLAYPYSNTGVPYQLSAAYSTPPGNNADYVTLEAASNRIPKTRINLNARVGLEAQDSEFSPNTADPYASGARGFSNMNAAVQGTSALSPDIRADVYNATISATSSPIPNATLRAYYGLDGRHVTLNQYLVYTGGFSDGSLSGEAYVIPQNWVKQKAGLKLGYLLVPRSNTRLTLGYRYLHTSRSDAEVGQSATTTMSLVLTTELGSKAFGRVAFEHADRTGTLIYLLPWYNLEQGSVPTAVPVCSSTSISSACSGASFEAPMNSNSLLVMVSYLPRRELSTDLELLYDRQSFTYPQAETLVGTGQGWKDDYRVSVGPDITYRPTNRMSYHMFYTFQRIFYDAIGNGACADSNTGGCAGSAGYFQDQYTSDVQTAGFESKWQITSKLNVGLHYTYSYGRVFYGLYNGVEVSDPTLSYQNVINYPQIISRMTDAKLTANYAVHANLNLLFLVGWEYYKDDNFNDSAAAIQGEGSSAIGFLTPGYGSPYYSVGYVMVGVRARF